MNEVTIRTDNSAEGIEKINRLWQDVMNGNTTLVINQDTVLISRYSHYASDETGSYDLSILAVDKEFLHQLPVILDAIDEFNSANSFFDMNFE